MKLRQLVNTQRKYLVFQQGTDWTRDYSQSGALRSLLGTVSTEKQGLPAEEVDEYLKKGYARNDRVGTSYLENNMKTYYKVKSKIRSRFRQ